MICSHCGNQLPIEDEKCPFCGQVKEAAVNQYRLYRCQAEGAPDEGQKAEWSMWETLREQTEEQLTAYRFRKVIGKIKEVYPIEG